MPVIPLVFDRLDIADRFRPQSLHGLVLAVLIRPVSDAAKRSRCHCDVLPIWWESEFAYGWVAVRYHFLPHLPLLLRICAPSLSTVLETAMPPYFLLHVRCLGATERGQPDVHVASSFPIGAFSLGASCGKHRRCALHWSAGARVRQACLDFRTFHYLYVTAKTPILHFQ